MNENSKICRELKYVEQQLGEPASFNKEAVIEDFKALYPEIGIKMNENGLAIFNYGIGANFTDPVIQEARGIIIDMVSLNVVCWPFRKFGKYDEPYADDIDWLSAVVQEKIDGSIIKFWFDEIKQKWVFSTNSTIYAEDAMANEDKGITFMDIIQKTPEYQRLSEETNGFKDSLRVYYTKIRSICNIPSKDLTFIFELTSPDNRVVVPYEEYHLRHIGTRDNKTGQEYDTKLMDIEKPKTYPLTSLEDCINAALALNINENSGKLGNLDNEGFVVVDKNYHRIKIKSPEYMMLHSIVSNSIQSKRYLIEMLYRDRIDLDIVGRNYPDLSHIIYYYKYKLEEVLYEAKAMIDITRKLSKKFTERKDIAIRIKDQRTSMLGFIYLNNTERTADDIIEEFYQKGKLLKLIPDYVGPDFSDCFREQE